MESFRRHALLASPALQRLVCGRVTLLYKDLIMRSFHCMPSIQRELEPHDGHPCSDPNQNHIGKSPGANPLDHATHGSRASNFFIRKSDLSSGISSSQPMCYILSTCYLHCARLCTMPLVVHVRPALLILITKRFPPCVAPDEKFTMCGVCGHHVQWASMAKNLVARWSLGRGICAVGDSLWRKLRVSNQCISSF